MDYFLIQNAHIAVATIEELQSDFPYCPSKKHSFNHLGGIACRYLLFLWQKKLNLIDNNETIGLNEQQFPYYFIVQKIKYQVSFSHSCQQVAVMIVPLTSLHDPIMTFGIDIEDKMISDAVARRFFCQPELTWLESLPKRQQQPAKSLLWTLKESLIKAKVEDKLVVGLKHNIMALMGEDYLGYLLKASTRDFNQVSLDNTLFGFSPRLKCGFVMRN